PANGTTMKSSPSASRNISIESEGVVPAPGEPTLYLPGSRLIRSISSLIVFTGKSALTTHEFGEAPALVTGMKSWATSYGVWLNRRGWTTMLDDDSSRV